jgi:hypothetical protein
MTSNGGRLIPDVTRLSFPKPGPSGGKLATPTRRGQPCPRLAPSASAWLGPKPRWPGRMSPQAHGAHVTSRGTMGTRPCNASTSHTPHLCLCGWPLGGLARSGAAAHSRRRLGRGAGTPSPTGRCPPQNGPERRRATGQVRALGRAHRRLGAHRGRGSHRGRRRARAETRRDGTAAKRRRTAGWLRHALRSTGQAHWRPAPRRGRSAVVCPPPAQPLVCQAYVRAGTAPMERLQRLEPALQGQGKAGRFPLSSPPARPCVVCHAPWPALGWPPLGTAAGAIPHAPACSAAGGSLPRIPRGCGASRGR